MVKVWRGRVTAPVARGGILILLLVVAGLTNPGTGGPPANLDGFGLGAPDTDDNTPRDVEASLAQWLTDLQIHAPGTSAHGGVLIHHTVAHRHDGTDYYRILPYSSNQGVVGLLQADAPGAIDVAAAWVDWYLDHAPDGVALDHWVTADGEETTCPPGQPTLCDHTDAEDSTASTFLWMARHYAETGSAAQDHLQTRSAEMHQVAQAVLGLQQDNGLTWARADYPVMYTMDNSETYAGLAAMAWLAEHVLGTDPSPYAAAAAATRAGIDAHLWDEATGRYLLALHPNGQRDATDMLTWYPGTVPVAWPHLWGAADDAARATAQMAQVDAAWSFPRPDWHHETVDATGFLWPSMGHAALLVGDVEGAQAHFDHVRCERMHPDDPTWFDWPFDAMDAGWALMSLAAGLEARDCA